MEVAWSSPPKKERKEDVEDTLAASQETQLCAMNAEREGVLDDEIP